MKQGCAAGIGSAIGPDAVASAQPCEPGELLSGREAGNLVGRVMDSRNILDVRRDGVEVRVRKVLETVFDRFAHASGRLRLAGQVSRAQIRREFFLGPAPNAADRIRRDVRRVPRPNLRARQGAAGFLLHQKAARRVTGAAMRGALHEIGAPIPFCRLMRVRHEGCGVQEQQVPAHHRRANVHWERKLGRRRALLDVLHRLREVQIERMCVLFGELRIGCVRHRGIEIGAIAPDTAAERPRKFFLRVAPYPEIRRWRDIGRINGAERRAERQPAGKGFAAWRRVAGAAVSGRCEIFPALDHGSRLTRRIGRLTKAGRRGCGETDEQRAEVVTGVAHDQPCLS